MKHTVIYKQMGHISQVTNHVFPNVVGESVEVKNTKELGSKFTELCTMFSLLGRSRDYKQLPQS